MTKTPFIQESNFLGILEGKRKKVIEEEKRKTEALKAQLFLDTSDARQQEIILSQQELNLQNEAKTKTILIVAVIVIAVMGGLFLIVKS
jgi:hypothetical protein